MRLEDLRADLGRQRRQQTVPVARALGNLGEEASSWSRSVPARPLPFEVVCQGYPSVSSAQKSFWHAVAVGCFRSVEVLLQDSSVDVNMYDVYGDQRQGGTAIHFAILEMPTWRDSEAGNTMKGKHFIKKFFEMLLEHGASVDAPCRYNAEWFLETVAGKTRSFIPYGNDALGLTLQFIDITRNSSVVCSAVPDRLEFVKEIILRHTLKQRSKRRLLTIQAPDDGLLLPSTLTRLFESGELSDVTLTCEGSSRKFPVHRVVLAMRSPVFQRMFASGFREAYEREVIVKGIEPDTLDSFLRFLYSGKLSDNVSVSDASKLVLLANKYNVSDLKLSCCRILARGLTTENALCVLRAAEDCSLSDLKHIAIAFVCEHLSPADRIAKECKTLGTDLVTEILEFISSSQPKKKRCDRSFGTLTKRLRNGAEDSSPKIMREGFVTESYLSNTPQPSYLLVSDGPLSGNFIRLPVSSSSSVASEAPYRSLSSGPSSCLQSR